MDPIELASKIVEILAGADRTTEIAAMSIADSLLMHQTMSKHDAWLRENSPSTVI